MCVRARGCGFVHLLCNMYVGGLFCFKIYICAGVMRCQQGVGVCYNVQCSYLRSVLKDVVLLNFEFAHLVTVLVRMYILNKVNILYTCTGVLLVFVSCLILIVHVP